MFETVGSRSGDLGALHGMEGFARTLRVNALGPRRGADPPGEGGRPQPLADPGTDLPHVIATRTDQARSVDPIVRLACGRTYLRARKAQASKSSSRG